VQRSALLVQGDERRGFLVARVEVRHDARQLGNVAALHRGGQAMLAVDNVQPAIAAPRDEQRLTQAPVPLRGDLPDQRLAGSLSRLR
jgi:hypothetical protein